MKFVIEMQGFTDNENAFLPKEIALVSLTGCRATAHWIVRPSISQTALTRSTRAKNNWVTRNHHGLNWYRGTSDLKYVVDELRKITKNADAIYTRGELKWEYLVSILDVPVINLAADLDNPSFAKMPTSIEKCAYHAKNQNFRCALNCSLKIRRWLLEGEYDVYDICTGGELSI